MRGGLVLFSDYDDDLRLVASEALEGAGFKVTGSSSEACTLSLLREGLRPDCLLVDANSAPEECLKSIQSFKSLLSRHNFSLILTSGRLDFPELIRHCGPAWLLPKPYGLENLVKVVEAAYFSLKSNT
jgi:DNA-binding NtrC family response regulator